MLRASQFRLLNVQATIFTPDPAAFSQPQVLLNILGPYITRFSGPTQALPLPDEVPAEIPRVILQSADQQWRLEAGPARIDSKWNSREGASANDADIVSSCTEVLEHYIQHVPVHVGRVALVLQRFCEADDPARELIDRFCKDEARENAFRRSSTFEIHNHKRYFITPDIQVNSWVRCKTASLASNNQPVILVEQDLNTLNENLLEAQFDVERIRTFFQLARTEANDILRLYFPERN